MPNEILVRLEKLLTGPQANSPLRFESHGNDLSNDPDSEPVDAAILSQLISDIYSHTGRSTDDIAYWLLRTIEDDNDNKVSREHLSKESDNRKSKQVTLQSFSVFLEKRIKRLHDIFSRIDTDNDGIVSLDDVYTYLRSQSMQYEPEKVDYVYSICDKDQDGKVHYDDFIRELVLVPNYGRTDNQRFFYRAYEFFTEDLEMSPDSDMMISANIPSGLGYFYAGGLAGVISRTCTAPFDRVKVYLIANSTRHAPLSMKDVILSIYKTGNPPGLRAFFTGNGLNIIKVLPESAMKFGGFETAKRVLASLEGVEDPADLSGISTFLAGGIGGMVSQLFVYPIDTLKFRVQCAAQTGGTRKGSVLKRVLTNMINEGGVRSFYRGLYVGVLGIFPFAALDLGIFSLFKAAYTRSEARRMGVDQSDVQLGNLAVLSMGAVSGSFGASVVYPVNLVRTRIQTQGTPAHPFTYNGFFDCWRQSVKREGWRGLFRGLGPNLAKVAPSVSISYLVYEKAKNMMNLR